VQRIGNSSITFEACCFHAEKALVSGELVYVFADPSTQTSRPVPPALRAVLEAFEAGEPMLNVSLGSWSDLGAEASALRQAVFVKEKGIASELEHDEKDSLYLHALARNRLGQAVGTGRLIEVGERQAKIGRMAVARDVRGAKVGEALLSALCQAAQARGCERALLHAQFSAIGFYKRLGFLPEGELFEEAGIAHQAMYKPLTPR
jgi:predicted GNAT family N-acyltransferase